MKTQTIPAVRTAMRQQMHAMIGNLFFGPLEAIPLRHTATRLNFRTVETGKHVSFLRSELGESVFIEYFVPSATSAL